MINDTPRLRQACLTKLSQNVGMVVYLILCLFLSNKETSCSPQHTYAYIETTIKWMFTPLIVFRIVGLFVSSNQNLRLLTTFCEFYSIVSWGFMSMYGFVLLFVNFPTLCFQTFDINFFNYLMIVLIGFVNGMLISMLLVLVICCSPCICMMISNENRRRSEMEEMKDTVINNLYKTSFKRELFQQNDECAICLDQFSEDCEVTPLPCDIRHYFHSHCIEDWIKENNICPLCKKEITVEGMKELSTQIKERQSQLEL